MTVPGIIARRLISNKTNGAGSCIDTMIAGNTNVHLDISHIKKGMRRNGFCRFPEQLTLFLLDVSLCSFGHNCDAYKTSRDGRNENVEIIPPYANHANT
jgi:hypothetical protein